MSTIETATSARHGGARPNLVALTGAAGFLGRFVCEALVREERWRCRALVRPGEDPKALPRERCEVVVGDLRSLEDVRGLVRGTEAVVNLAFWRGGSADYNLAAARNVERACREAGIRRLVHCSTAVVTGDFPGRDVTEETPCRAAGEYERIKLAIEELLHSSADEALRVTVVRPTAIFGAGGANLIKLAAGLRDGNRAVQALRSFIEGRRRMNLVPVRTVAAAVVFLLGREPRHEFEVFIVSDDENPLNNYGDVERLIAGVYFPGRKLWRLRAPWWVLAFLLRVMGRSHVDPRREYRCDRLIEAGFSKPVDFAEEVGRFARFFSSEGTVGQGATGP
ncbi:MAG: NAD-dependent epimerase/dehydratase family protein [Thermoanaerobaculales bacterium]